VTYPSFPPTRLSPSGRERASGSLATQFIGWASPWPPCALFILRVMTHRRVLKLIADIPTAARLVISKIFCSYVKSWLATAPMKQVYHKYCTMAQFIIRLDQFQNPGETEVEYKILQMLTATRATASELVELVRSLLEK
jgi:hypothetical protein